MMHTHTHTHTQGVDWQAITDMTIQQYSRRLRGLVSSRFTTIQLLSAEAARIWEPFIDPDHPSMEDEIQRYANWFVPGNVLKTRQAYRAIYAVNERISPTLATVLYADHVHVFAAGRLHELMDSLARPVEKECRGCQDDEFCAILIWPQGSVEDYEHPRCHSFYSAYSGRDYWGPDYWGPIWH